MSMRTRAAGLLSAAALLALAVAGCGGPSGSAHHARYGNGAAASPPLVRGTIASVSPGELVVQTTTGTTTVKTAQPFHVYRREPATLADVKDNVFIGVTTVKNPDGAEQATEIHIFPEALRGLGEGSRMMAPNAGGGRRMTNGAVSGDRMTNGAVAGTAAAAQSRMSNGNVTSANGSTLVVQYAGGSVQVVVPPNTPVTRLVETTAPLTPGEQVVVPATRQPDGSLSSDKALLGGK